LKIYISADGEGISGVVSSEEMHHSGREYPRFRKLMTQDVNAAIEGAYNAGATEVVVNDSHWSMLNILYEELDPRAEIIRGFNKDLCMVEQIDQEFDGAFFIGYHAKVGHSHGVANETMFGPEMYETRMNGIPVGEMEINAALAGHFGVPVVMVSGDDIFAKEVKESLGNVETAVVKYAIDRFAARCLSLQKSHELIKDSAYQAVKRIKEFKPYVVDGPVELEVEFTSTAECRRAGLVPGSYFKSPRIIAYKGENIVEAWKGIFACLLLGSAAIDHIYG
jgi:D-amino peptidase